LIQLLSIGVQLAAGRTVYHLSSLAVL